MKRSALPHVPNREEKNVYDIKEKLGEGDYGSVVYKAQNTNRGDLAIIKKFPSNDHQVAFIKDLRKMSDLDTVHVLKLYGMMVQDKSLWLALEYCEARSINDIMLVFGRPLKETHIRTVLQHTLRGLDYLHHLAIIHRGIKCRNILINSQGICKLSEFGTAGHGADTLTMDSFIGNSFWLAPEVLQEVQYNIQADIWSVGITVIEMGEGVPPYSTVHPMRVMLDIPNKAPPTFHNPDIWTRPLKTFLKCCLQKIPTDRQSAAQLLQHKIIKRADWKGIQGITQKAIKVLNKEHSGHNQSEHSKSDNRTITLTQQGQNTVIDSDDDVNWAESGTLVWNPTVVKSHHPSKPQPSTSSTSSTATLSEVQLQVDVCDEEYEMETVRPSDFGKAKEQSNRDKSKGKENRKSKNLENVSKKEDNRKSRNLEVEAPTESNQRVSPKINAKKNKETKSKISAKQSLPEKNNQYDESTVELFSAKSKNSKLSVESNSKNRKAQPSSSSSSSSVKSKHPVPDDSTKHPVPDDSTIVQSKHPVPDDNTIKISDGKINPAAPEIPAQAAPEIPAQAAPEIPAQAAPEIPSPAAPEIPAPAAPEIPAPAAPDTIDPIISTSITKSPIRRPSSSKSIDEIPYFMQYYDKNTPATFGGEVPLVTRTFAELEAQLEDLRYQRGQEMELLKNQYIHHWYDIMQCIELKGGFVPPEPPNIYNKLSKAELLIQLSMIQRRHKETSATLLQRFKLEKQFIRDTARQSTNQSKALSMTRDLELKDAEYQTCLSELKQSYRHEYEFILKAIKFVDYTVINKT